MRPVEPLEGRTPMSAFGLFHQTNLVSDRRGVAPVVDPALVNPAGIAAAPNAGAFWVSATGKGLSELYIGDVNGSPMALHNESRFIPGSSTLPG